MFAFTKQNVDAAPLENGVYLLYVGNELTYIGCSWGDTGSIRSRLQSHYGGREGSCTQSSTAFEFEVTTMPLTTETNLLTAYRARFGRLPRCNERIG